MNNKFFASLLLTSALLTTMNACVAMDRPEDKKNIPSHPKGNSSMTDDEFKRTIQKAIEAIEDDKSLFNELTPLIANSRFLYLTAIIPHLVANNEKAFIFVTKVNADVPGAYKGLLLYKTKLENQNNPEAKKQLPYIEKAILRFENETRDIFDRCVMLNLSDPIKFLLQTKTIGSTFAQQKLDEIKQSEDYQDLCNAQENTLGLILRQEESRHWFEEVYTPQFLKRPKNTEISFETIQNFASQLFIASARQINYEPAQQEASKLRLSQGYKDAAKGKLDRKKTRDPLYCLGLEFHKRDCLNDGLKARRAEKTQKERNENRPSLPQKKASVGIANSWTGETINSAQIETGKIVAQKILGAHYLEMPSIIEGAKRGDAHAYARFLTLVKQGDTSFYSFFFSYLEAGDPEAYDLFARLFNDSTAFPQSILDYTENLRKNIINPTLLAVIERALAQAENLKKKAAIDLQRKADETACLRLAKESWGKDNKESIAHYIMAEHYGIPEGIELLTCLRQSENYKNPTNASPNDPGAILRDYDDAKKAQSLYYSFLDDKLLPADRAARLYEAVQLGHEQALQMAKERLKAVGCPDVITDVDQVIRIVKEAAKLLSKNPTDEERALLAVGLEYLMLEYNSACNASPAQNSRTTISEDQKPSLSEKKEAEHALQTASISSSQTTSELTTSSSEDSSKSTQSSAPRETRVDTPREIGATNTSNDVPAQKDPKKGSKSDKPKAKKTLKPSKNDSQGGKTLQRTRSLTNVSRPSENTSSIAAEKPKRGITRTQSLMNLGKFSEDAEQPSLDKSEKKLTHRNSVSKEEAKDVKKFLKRRDSQKKLERRESESKITLEKPWVIPSIKSKYKDILVRVARGDNVSNIKIKKFVHAAEKLGYEQENQSGGGGHKDLVPPHRRGKWTIPTDKGQFIVGRYPQQLSEFLLETLEIKPEAIPVRGKPVLDKKS